MHRTGWFAGIVVILILSGCAGLVRKQAVPDELTASAVVPGFADVRYRVGIDDEALLEEALDSFRRETAYLEATGYSGALPPVNFLAVSGGGDQGAFGAGLLNGWSAAGDRPEFKLVTGVSTGALIAPFAFLGPEYDDRLKKFYTTLSPSDIVKKRSIFAALVEDALGDNTPLQKLIEKAVDQAVLDDIAHEYEKGCC